MTAAPIAPCASSSRARTTSGQYWEFSATMKTVPARRAASWMRAQASSVSAIGFSSSTCLPAANACVASSSCRSCGTMMSTASNSPAASAGSREAKVRAPVRAAIAAAALGSGSTAAVTRVRGAACSMPSR